MLLEAQKCEGIEKIMMEIMEVRKEEKRNGENEKENE